MHYSVEAHGPCSCSIRLDSESPAQVFICTSPDSMFCCNWASISIFIAVIHTCIECLWCLFISTLICSLKHLDENVAKTGHHWCVVCYIMHWKEASRKEVLMTKVPFCQRIALWDLSSQGSLKNPECGGLKMRAGDCGLSPNQTCVFLMGSKYNI